MKTITLLTAVVASALLATPAAHAAKVGKLAGNYEGSGVLTDKRTAPMSVYRYTFSDLVVKVSSKGGIKGTATVTAAISSMGGPFMTITTQALTVSGKATKVKVAKGKITATGALKFSDGTEVQGKFSVKAKTGKGSFKVNESDAQFDASFTVKK